MLFVAPRAKILERADMLDLERSEGRWRGLLHGMPVVLKVCNVSNVVVGGEKLVGRE